MLDVVVNRKFNLPDLTIMDGESRPLLSQPVPSAPFLAPPLYESAGTTRSSYGEAGTSFDYRENTPGSSVGRYHQLCATVSTVKKYRGTR